jgi:protein O-mannosyl-transferase
MKSEFDVTLKVLTISSADFSTNKNPLGGLGMSRSRRLRRKEERANAKKSKGEIRAVATTATVQPPISRASLWLVLAFLLPNLGAVACGFVWDDLAVIVNNKFLHSLRYLTHVWTSGYWPDGSTPQLFRPVSETIWAILWAVVGARPAIFHAFGLVAGTAVVVLLYRFLLTVQMAPRVAFTASLLFALFPIHTEATTSIVGSAETISAALGLAALIFYYHRRPIPALILFALAVFSKESAVAFAALPLAFPPKDRRRDSLFPAVGAGVVVATALLMHRALASGPLGRVMPETNPIILLSIGPRILTALWVQCLYMFKTLLPITLSADYSFNQIPLVMGFGDWRAWSGLVLVSGAIFLAVRHRQFRAPIFAWMILFSATANILFLTGTIMGERLAYAPSLGVALLLAILLARSRHWKIVLVVVALVFAVRTAVRNLDWLNQDRFDARLAQTAPNSMRIMYRIGGLRGAAGDYQGAIDAYSRTIEILPTFAPAYCYRGKALGLLGRNTEAMASINDCHSLDDDQHTLPDEVRYLKAWTPEATRAFIDSPHGLGFVRIPDSTPRLFEWTRIPD